MTISEQSVNLTEEPEYIHGVLARWMRSNREELEEEFVSTIHSAAKLAGKVSCGSCVGIEDGHNVCRDSFYVMSGILTHLLNSKAQEEQASRSNGGPMIPDKEPQLSSLPRSVRVWIRECTAMQLNGTAHHITKWVNFHGDLSSIQSNAPAAIPVLKPYSEV